MIDLFIKFEFINLVDILLVALLLYELYMLIRGTVALSIIMGIFLFYLAWLLAKALNMELMSTILGQFMGVGVLALIIVFQQEIRRMFLTIGTKYKLHQKFSLDTFFSKNLKQTTDEHLRSIVQACEDMAKTKTGALIVIARDAELKDYTRTGERLNARISPSLIETIFFKNSPLHDGAVIIVGNKIVAARCILPISDKQGLNPEFGLRHRAALGMSENTDSQIIIVSEERGTISYALTGEIKQNLEPYELMELLESGLTSENFDLESNTEPVE
ncbi:MAG: diadenylate cyclase CdaA [Bacteroidota bacterium]|nr:diadenylate cyclase CdaA [Bacteroidota bacterium]MDP4204476.1 diadenylate cyclase CdaA [Bacteroidota bacterium]